MKRTFLYGALFLFLMACGSLLWASVPRGSNSQERASNPELDVLVKRAESLVARKLYDDAIDVYRQCIKMSPKDATLYNRLGVAYHRKQALSLAKSNYEKATKLDDKYGEAYNNLGTIAFTESRFNRAIRYYEKAIKLRPEAATMHYNLASAYFAKEKFEKAFDEYRMALSMDPDLIEHVSATGSMVRTAGFNQAKYHFYLAKIYASMGNNDRAIDYLTRAFEEGFKDKDLLYSDSAFAALIKDEKFTRLMQKPPKPIE
jgi:tetratricopeptide (TPR) repeat protein